ncbi:hypothetical protein ACQP00_32765 [Dactylosporangium sp. CS-047395]|uniref:hypothetical protein n=1 Tax=Dactylosporangium sp. CS-047395 TaxID=3239936 RepID=UPI003D94205C
MTAVPLAIWDQLEFRAMCLLLAVVLVLMAMCVGHIGLFLYLPAALPLVAAALPKPGWCPRAKFVAVGVALAAVLVLYVRVVGYWFDW